MPSEPFVWMKLAGSFPAGLVTNQPDSLLKEGDSPNVTNLDINADGYMAYGAQPTGTARVQKEYTISLSPWYMHYRRLWQGSLTQIKYNSPEYTDVILKQGKGWIDCTDDATSVLIKPIPIGTGGLIFFKGTGAYILPSADNLGGNFGNPVFQQEAFVTDISYAAELDGLVYFVNTHGLFSVNVQGKVELLSDAVDGNLTPAAITMDYSNKYVNIGTAMTYRVSDGKFFKYDTTTAILDYYSPQLRSKDNSTISVNKVAFEFDKTSTTSGEIHFKTQAETRGWSLEYKLPVLNRDELKEQASYDVDPFIGLTWQLHITQLPTNIKLKNIWVRVKGFTAESREA